MQTRRRCRHCALVFGVDTLEIVEVVGGGVGILALVDDVARQRRLTQCKQFALEFVVRTVVEEAQRATATRRVVDDLGHHRAALVEKQFVADANLSRRLHQHVPQAHILIQFAQQKHLDFRVGFLLRAVQSRRKHLRIVENEGVALVEVVEHVLELKEIALDGVSLVVALEHIDGFRLAMKHHQTALVATREAHGFLRSVLVLKLTINAVGIQRNLLLGQLKLKLR